MDKEKNIDDIIKDWINGNISEEDKQNLVQEYDLELMNKLMKESGELSLPSFDQSAEWQKLQKGIRTESSTKVIRLRRSVIISIAASLLFILGFLFLLSQWQNEIHNMYEEVLSHNLPDGSSVRLAPYATIHYKKFRWQNNRQIQLEGDAEFTVNPGNQFTVQFHNGQVRVIGTIFSIDQQNDLSVVKCFEGKVAVESNSSSIDISAGESVTIDPDSKLEKKLTYLETAYWTKASSRYDNINLGRLILILKEIYGIKIENSIEKEIMFSGTVIHNNLSDALELALGSIEVEYEFISADSLRLYQK